MSGRPDGGQQLYYGLYPAKVTDAAPDDLGRIEVELPWLGKNKDDEAAQAQGDGEEFVKVRATIVSLWANENRGFLAIPDEDSQVIVGFEAGNLHRPYIVGACWNGKAKMPATGTAGKGKNTDGKDTVRVVKTKDGSFLEFDDDADTITLSTKSGNKLVLDYSGQGKVELTHSMGHKLVLEGSGAVTLEAKNTLTVKAPSGINVTAPTTTYSGNIVCVDLTATGVITGSINPTVGNLL